MSIRNEIAEVVKSTNMLDWAEKVSTKRNLSKEETEVSQLVDAWAKDVGEKGSDEGHEISAFIRKTIDSNPTYTYPSELFDMMFDMDAIGEFDDIEYDEVPKNTLVAYESAKGGNVPKSYLDTAKNDITWKHLQVETRIPYARLRRNGYLTIASATMFAKEALEEKRLQTVMGIINSELARLNPSVGTKLGNLITVNGALTMTAMDALSLWVLDHSDGGDTGFVFTQNKYAQAIARMAGHNSYMSNDMKNEFNKYGLVKEYGGLLIGGYSGAKKTADGQPILSDGIFGISGKIGQMVDRGELRIYETMNNSKEAVDLKFTGYEFGTKITRIDKIAKIEFSN